jgi:hypothetical protein
MWCYIIQVEEVGEYMISSRSVRWHRKMKEGDRRMFSKIGDMSNIYRMYDVMNDRWWGGELELKHLELVDCGRVADGWYIPEESRIKIDEGLGLLCRAGVLLHELCHLSVDMEYGYLEMGERLGRIPWHGRLWKEEMGRVGFAGRIYSTSGNDRFS